MVVEVADVIGVVVALFTLAVAIVRIVTCVCLGAFWVKKMVGTK